MKLRNNKANSDEAFKNFDTAHRSVFVANRKFAGIAKIALAQKKHLKPQHLKKTLGGGHKSKKSQFEITAGFF
jgi:hypothetical protein